MNGIHAEEPSLALAQFQQRLRNIHPGVFPDDPDMLSWLSPAVVVLLKEHAI